MEGKSADYLSSGQVEFLHSNLAGLEAKTKGLYQDICAAVDGATRFRPQREQKRAQIRACEPQVFLPDLANVLNDLIFFLEFLGKFSANHRLLVVIWNFGRVSGGSDKIM